MPKGINHVLMDAAVGRNVPESLIVHRAMFGYVPRMAEKGETRRQYILLDAINADDGKLFKIQVSFDRMQAVARRSLGHASECGYILPVILQKPTAIFEGLRHDDDEDRRGVGWRCYCGVPSNCYRPDGTVAPPYPRQVFLVFVNEDRVAYNWRWEKADEKDGNLPINHAERFKRRLL